MGVRARSTARIDRADPASVDLRELRHDEAFEPRHVRHQPQAVVSAAGAAVVPDFLFVPTSPLSAYTVNGDELPSIANREYVREATIAATHGVEMSNWFDQQDLFFVPFTTFTMRDRPGPEIQ